MVVSCKLSSIQRGGTICKCANEEEIKVILNTKESLPKGVDGIKLNVPLNTHCGFSTNLLFS